MLFNHVERADRVEKSARSARSTRLSKRYGEVIGKSFRGVVVCCFWFLVKTQNSEL